MCVAVPTRPTAAPPAPALLLVARRLEVGVSGMHVFRPGSVSPICCSAVEMPLPCCCSHLPALPPEESQLVQAGPVPRLQDTPAPGTSCSQNLPVFGASVVGRPGRGTAGLQLRAPKCHQLPVA